MKTNAQPFWRSLDELAGTPAFHAALHREFPPGAPELERFDRRSFLKAMGASLALAALPACTRQPVGKLVPYVKAPEDLVPGKPQFYATAMTLGGFATGLLVESHEGHPTKIEGNPRHPANRGATGIFQQAALLDLYDPDRSQAVLNRGQPATWDQFVSNLADILHGQRAKQGRGLRLLTGTVTSPTLAAQLGKLSAQFPEARWHQYEPVNRDNSHRGAQLAFGEVVGVRPHFDRAQIILSLDADFLHAHPDSLRYIRDFASGRRPSGGGGLNRLYVVESRPTITGSNADHRLPLGSSKIESFARALAQRLGVNLPADSHSRPTAEATWLDVLAADLLANAGRSLVVAGESQPPEVHALAHALNERLGNIGRTVTFTPPAESEPVNQTDSLRQLVDALAAGEVEALVIVGGNPVFNAPANFRFAEKLARAPFRAHLSPDVNETSVLCTWHIPQSHFLESWGDARAFDGTLSIIQPLILPMYGTKSAVELLDAMVSPPGRSDYDIVRDFWASGNPDADFQTKWRRALLDGYLENSALPEKTVTLRAVEFSRLNAPGTGLEITFHPDPTLFDGCFANNGWLQELPQPITKLTWDNAALVAPSLAEKEHLTNGDLVEVQFQNQTVSLPVWVTPGQAAESVALFFGNGRRQVGEVGRSAGFDVYPLRTADAPWFATGAALTKTGRKHPLAATQTQHLIDSEERQIIREGTLADFQSHPDFVRKNSELPGPGETLFDPAEFPDNGYKWGMSIDLTACIGCSACTLACQAENNIPVVGKTEVARGRAMHWIRVDTYFRGAPAEPAMTHQPVPCMQCENAPCELVCPVGATVHDQEGLNLQVYNRCVGTRYCSNNCPYKVRRFNFFQYADYRTPSLEPMRNPNVTVRWRGVMEKCTYCIQRISAARITTEEQNRTIRDGELQTACQQACPAQAIVFGNLNDPRSRVSRLSAHPLAFSMLGELNTRPRTTYLAKLRNPNPRLA